MSFSSGFGLLLVLPTWRRNGLRLGRLRGNVGRVLLVCGGPVLITAIVYPNLPVRPFGGMPATMWLISPFARDSIFIGYLYGRLEQVFPGYVHPRIPAQRALFIGAVFFTLWHAPGLFSDHPGYVLFQLAYTSVGYVLTGLSRQWTGSFLYVTLCHSSINWIAWTTS